MVKIKTYIITVAVLIGLGAVAYFYQLRVNNKLISDIKKDLQREKQVAVNKLSEELKDRDLTINQLILSNEKAQAESKHWYDQAKKKVVNPNYDIDFITAANILSNSNYRPDKRNDSIGSGGDD